MASVIPGGKLAVVYGLLCRGVCPLDEGSKLGVVPVCNSQRQDRPTLNPLFGSWYMYYGPSGLCRLRMVSIVDQHGQSAGCVLCAPIQFLQTCMMQLAGCKITALAAVGQRDIFKCRAYTDHPVKGTYQQATQSSPTCPTTAVV